MDAIEAIKSRRSIRRYKSTPVPDEVIFQLIDAARHAPSARSSQPWEFVIVRNIETKVRLSRLHSFSGFLEGASLIVVALSNEFLSRNHFVEDCSAALENLLIAVHALGLGACWVAVYVPGYKKYEDVVRRILGIPGNLRVIAMVGVGYPDETPSPKSLKDFESIVHWELYGRKFAG